MGEEASLDAGAQDSGIAQDRVGLGELETGYIILNRKNNGNMMRQQRQEKMFCLTVFED